MASRLPLVVIVGPTASGKTGLGIDLAKQFDGEIICADSRTVYKDMDIGTAKVTRQQQAQVPHWGIDLVQPGEYFSAADFKRYAGKKIDEIRARDKIPFLVGGTGLYIDAVLFDYSFGKKADLEMRQDLNNLTIEQLQDYCYKNSIKLPGNALNKRYVIRAIEQKNIRTKRRAAPIEDTIIVGMSTERTILRTRIVERTEQLFQNGVVEEAKMLGEKYGWNSEAMTGNIYPLLRLYLLGGVSSEEVKNKFTTLDWRLAKRQMTWFRRNGYIHWLQLTEAKQYIIDQLANYERT